ncbi:hypothetical protein EYV94_20055 [Puteibacter caeruleilacunae]|nr:hypothetical protein EYV94_20055 [Puteibacter caeruleilacunae]
MGRVLVIGSGSTATSVVQVMQQYPQVFSSIVVADEAQYIDGKLLRPVTTMDKVITVPVDPTNSSQLIDLIYTFRPQLVINATFSNYSLHIMDACLETEVSYLDIANYRHTDKERVSYRWQWSYQNRFKEAGITAILGCGIDPGITGVFAAHAAKHHFDEIQHLDIINYDASYNYPRSEEQQESTNDRRFWCDGDWQDDREQQHADRTTTKLVYNEELESLVKNFPTIKEARCWQSTEQTESKAALVECTIKGKKKQEQQSVRIQFGFQTACDYQDPLQSISHYIGIPVVVGAVMFMQGNWNEPGVYNVEEFDPDPFIPELENMGLSWQLTVNKQDTTVACNVQ